MTVAVLIPTRDRVALLQTTVAKLLETRELETTSIVVGIDEDDFSDVHRHPSVVVSAANREDTLGRKYNRCFAAASPMADIYIIWADDMTILTKGWDAKIAKAAELFTDGMGLIFFGRVPGVLQPGIAVTRGMVDAMGELCDPSYAFWWQDTRLIEIGRMADRIVSLGSFIEVQCLTDLKGKSRGVRDLAWWGSFFDATRPQRMAIAEKIIKQGRDQPFRKQQLLERLPSWDKIFTHSNSKCSDPVEAKKLEAHYAFDAPADERYLRVKARAEKKLAQMQKVAA